MSVNNRGKKILLVDDDQALRTVLAEQLDLYDGFNTIQVGTAAEGLEKAKLAHYDAILLDIGLPDMDGRELCKLMRRQGVRAPVIMLTAADSRRRHHPRPRIRAPTTTSPSRFASTSCSPACAPICASTSAARMR